MIIITIITIIIIIIIIIIVIITSTIAAGREAEALERELRGEAPSTY